MPSPFPNLGLSSPLPRLGLDTASRPQGDSWGLPLGSGLRALEACPSPPECPGPHLVVVPVDVGVEFLQSFQTVGSGGVILGVARGG